MTRKHVWCAPAIVGLCVISFCVQGEEGFWLHSAPPLAQWQSEYGFKPSAAWLSNLLRSTARFNSGANSGFFASQDGLFVTNFHIGKPMVRMLVNGQQYIDSGLYTPNPDEALRIPNAELRSPDSVEDVTAQVLAAIPAGASIEQAVATRKRVIAELEARSQKKTGLRSTVVELYSGARYELYRYRIYTDVRLVFIPESSIGMLDDPGNAMPPDDEDSFNFDVCFFRVYDDGKPVKLKHHLRLSLEPVEPNELLIASGDPGGSARYDTIAQLQFQRDIALPFQIERDRRIEIALTDAGERDSRVAASLASRLQAIRDRRAFAQIRLDALQDQKFMEPKAQAEQRFIAQFSAAPFDRIEQAENTSRELFPKYFLLDTGAGFNSDVLAFAQALAKLDSDSNKARARRQEEFLTRSRVTNLTYERIRLNAWFDMLVERLGRDDFSVQAILGGQSPQALANSLIKRTRILDPNYRKSLLDGASTGSEDPLIALARTLKEQAQEVRGRYEIQEQIISEAQTEITRASIKIVGKAQYPDATNTPRLAYGTLKGTERDGQQLPAWSTFGALYRFIEQQTRRQPLVLPPRWRDKQAALNSGTPFNLFTTIDSVGGNSGTPVVNRHGEVVGVIDAGNLDTSASAYFYNDTTMRFILVGSIAIVEGLRKVYGANDLAEELIRGRR